MEKLRVAIIGQGRSGRDIHGRFFQSEDNTLYEVVCIVEQDERRRLKAAEEFGCDVVANYTELFERDDIDLVVNASFSEQHYPITKDLLAHGKNVLSEKPFGRTYFECMDLFHTAKENNVIVTAFHQTLYSPAFLKIKEIIAGGKLGEVFQINLKYSGFARRWDWQTLQSKCAGSIYNSGPHPIGQALDLLGWDDHTRVAFSSLGKALTSGDADDIGMLILTAPGKPVVNIEINCADAYANDYVFKVFGKKGTLIATNVDYQMKYIEDFSAYPERPLIRESLTNAEGNPDYCKEELHFTEVKEKLTGTPFDVAAKQFYEMLYNTIKNGVALDVTPEKAAKAISVIETCHAQNPMPVLFD